MGSFMPYETPSSTSTSASSPSMPSQSSSSHSDASTCLKCDLASPPNSRGSSSTLMQNHASPRVLRSFASSMLGLRETDSSSTSKRQPSVRAGPMEDEDWKEVGISVSRSNMVMEDFFQDKFLSGDIVRRVEASKNRYFTSPFTSGKRGLLEELHHFHERGMNTLTIQVTRGKREITRTALVVPVKGVKKKKYVLHDSEDPSYTFSFDDYTSKECSTLQERGLRLVREHLPKMRVAAEDVDYPCEQKMENARGFSMMYSMLVVPRAHVDARMSQSNTLEDVVFRGITWLHGSTGSGVPLIFRSIQTEPIITEDVEHSSNVDLSSIASSGTYNLQRSQSFVDHRVVIRAVRIWFSFPVVEVKVELEAKQGEGMLGVSIDRTKEGFCYVADVDPETAAERAGLKERLHAGLELGMKLVVTKVGNESVLPTFMSNGRIRCYDNASISSKLSAHCHAGEAICLHVLDIRDDAACPTEVSRARTLDDLFMWSRG